MKKLRPDLPVVPFEQGDIVATVYESTANPIGVGVVDCVLPGGLFTVLYEETNWGWSDGWSSRHGNPWMPSKDGRAYRGSGRVYWIQHMDEELESHPCLMARHRAAAEAREKLADGIARGIMRDYRGRVIREHRLSITDRAQERPNGL